MYVWMALKKMEQKSFQFSYRFFTIFYEVSFIWKKFIKVKTVVTLVQHSKRLYFIYLYFMRLKWQTEVEAISNFLYSKISKLIAYQYLTIKYFKIYFPSHKSTKLKLGIQIFITVQFFLFLFSAYHMNATDLLSIKWKFQK